VHIVVVNQQQGSRTWRVLLPSCCPAHSHTGCLCKKTLGTAGGGLVHTVWNELGPDVTRYTINNIQFTVNHWLLQVGVLGQEQGQGQHSGKGSEGQLPFCLRLVLVSRSEVSVAH
jgi:hypothetical protein